MAFRLDQRLSYQNLEECQFADFGYLEECIECINFDKCEHRQYEALGLTDFYCRDNPDMERRENV